MKKIYPIAFVLFAFLTAIPVMPARAVANTQLSVSPGDARADLGADFTVNVMVQDMPALCGYDFTLEYNNQVLRATSASLGGTVFDLENDGDVRSDVNGDGVSDVFVARASVQQIIGRIRYALVLVAIPGITVELVPMSLLSVNFHVDSEGSSALDLSDDILVSCAGAGPMAQPHTTMDGTYNLPAILQLVRCFPQHGPTAEPMRKVFCTVKNTDPATAHMARVDFMWRSVGGSLGSASAEMLIQPGQTATLEATIPTPVRHDVFFVSANVVRVHTTQDLTLLDVPVGSALFKFKAKLPA